MTRFRNKIIWFWNTESLSMTVVLVARSYDNPWNVTLYFGSEKCITLSELNEVIFNEKFAFQSKKANSSSWHELINRYFSSKTYVKSGELYIYDTPDII